MSSRPLEYECLKAILKHTEANRRFEISMRIPSVVVAERTTPLKITRLRFSNDGVEVNGVKHTIDLYKSPMGNGEEESIECGRGTLSDIDQYGIDDTSSDLVRTEGDVQIQIDGLLTDQVVNIPELELQLQHDKDYLKKLKKNESGIPEEDGEVFYMERDVENRECHLAPFYRRRDNLPLPYKPLIRYTKSLIFSKDEVEAFPYTIKLHEARRNLNSSFFGKKSHPIEVELMELPCPEGLLNIRLPRGVNFAVKSLDFDGEIGKTFDAIAPIIHSSSFPFTQIKWTGGNMIGLEHNLIRSAKTLVLNGAYCENQLSLNQLFTMNQMKLIIKDAYCVFDTESQLIDAIRIWVREEAPLGKSIKMEFPIEIGRKLLDVIGVQLNGFVSENRVVIPTENISEIVVEIQTRKGKIIGLQNGDNIIRGSRGFTLLPEDTIVLRGKPRSDIEVSIQPRGYHRSLLDF